MTSERGGERPDRVWTENADKKKPEGFPFHVSSTKLCLTFEFSPRLSSVKSCQITLKGLELPGETSDCNQTGFLHCPRHFERSGGERGGRAGEGELAEEKCAGCVSFFFSFFLLLNSLRVTLVHKKTA